MITCEACGRVNGKGPIGTSWICQDCKESIKAALTDEGSKNKLSKPFSEKVIEQLETKGKLVGD